jgi:hypothetical protein
LTVLVRSVLSKRYFSCLLRTACAKDQIMAANAQNGPEIVINSAAGTNGAKRKGVGKWNALKHGILSRSVVVRNGDSEETQKSFDYLHSSLRSDLKPVGALEEILVEKIAVCYWRLRRVLRSETGEIEESLGSDTSRLRHSLLGLLPEEQRRQHLREHSDGINCLIYKLDELSLQIRTDSGLSTDEFETLERIFGPELPLIVDAKRILEELGLIRPGRPDANVSRLRDPSSAKELKREVLKLISEYREFLEGEYEKKRTAELQKAEVRARVKSAPSSEAIDRLNRYQVSLEKQFYRAIQQLERQQRMRKGEFVSPPALVTLDSH